MSNIELPTTGYIMGADDPYRSMVGGLQYAIDNFGVALIERGGDE